MADDFGHVPVLLDRCVELLLPALTRHDPDGSGAVLVDATLGAGGHSERFLTDLPGLRVIGLDRDPSALQIARDRLAPFGSRFTAVRTRYDGIVDALGECGYAASGSINGVLFDLGVSSMQLDRTERGFSYAADAPLDMRMDPDLPLTAADILNTFDARDIAKILRDFGDERYAPRIAAQIVRRREQQPFARTGELVELLYDAIPAPARRTGGHPAKRTFQALRVAVNAELDSLRAALPAALAALAAILKCPDAESYTLFVVGHTDDTPIRKPEMLTRHPDNWYLSVHRALLVKRALVRAGLDDARLAVAGFGPARPLDPAAVPGRGAAANRRVEVWLLPRGRCLEAPAR